MKNILIRFQTKKLRFCLKNKLLTFQDFGEIEKEKKTKTKAKTKTKKQKKKPKTKQNKRKQCSKTEIWVGRSK